MMIATKAGLRRDGRVGAFPFVAPTRPLMISMLIIHYSTLESTYTVLQTSTEHPLQYMRLWGPKTCGISP